MNKVMVSCQNGNEIVIAKLHLPTASGNYLFGHQLLKDACMALEEDGYV